MYLHPWLDDDWVSFTRSLQLHFIATLFAFCIQLAFMTRILQLEFCNSACYNSPSCNSHFPCIFYYIFSILDVHRSSSYILANGSTSVSRFLGHQIVRNHLWRWTQPCPNYCKKIIVFVTRNSIKKDGLTLITLNSNLLIFLICFIYFIWVLTTW